MSFRNNLVQLLSGAAVRLTAVSALALVCATGSAMAQGKAPTGPVDMTVGAGAGGSPDVVMRTVLKIMNEEKIINIPAAVQNRPGGSGAVAYNYVLGRPGDGNLLLTTNQSTYTTPMMQGTPSVVTRLKPIAAFIQSELVMMVHPDSPYKTMKDFVEAAKKAPGKLRVSGAQAGGTDHLATALIEKAGGIKLTYVPFDGGSAALAAFLGGNVEATYGTLEEGLAVFQSGKARPLAILSEKRRPEDSYKNVPTAKEQGYDVVFGQEWGVAAPPNTDPEILKYWDDKFRKVVASKSWQDGLKAKFQRSDYKGLDQIEAHTKKMEDMYRGLMTDIGLAKKQ